ncbi:right-handed parallel beta-helix repeat-containing protein [Haloferula chungangensis]|uniref:Right-handed parallel beta-helix repeat-containing protein n=1 Tax=Haloferula chungangensis TaxID=1048331 RepID=A0ABW2L0M7_9BACT
MTLDEAKKVLGLSPSEDPAGHVEEFTAARERIAEMVRNASNETIEHRYQYSLLEFDKALAVVREEIERKRREKLAQIMILVPGAVAGHQKVSFKKPEVLEEKEEPKAEPGKTGISQGSKAEEADSKTGELEEILLPEDKPSELPPPPPTKPAGELGKPATAPVSDDDDEDPEVEKKGRGRRMAGYALIILLLGGLGVGWVYTRMEAERKQRNLERVMLLEEVGAQMVEARRWDEATQAYSEIADLDPGSQLAENGIRSIEVGMAEEQRQFVGYWTGESLAALEAGRIDEAEAAAKKVLKKYPEEMEAAELLSKIEAEKLVKIRQEWEGKIRASIESGTWSEAESALESFSSELPEDPLIQELGDLIAEKKEQERKDHARARELAEAARLRDQGKYDPLALEWMREAVALAPHDAEMKALYEKLASYSRTLRIPEDFKSLADALGEARDRDRIVLAEGSFEAGVVVNSAVQLEGVGEGKTILKMAAQEGPVLTFGPGSKGATVTGVVLQHEGFDAGTSRYPVALVRGSEMEFSDCEFLEASGHGMAVVDGGHAIAQRCVFRTNGWDGAAASGAGSRMTIHECESTGNFGHGYEIWDGASAVLSDSKGSRNSRNGVLADSAAEGIEIRGGEFFGNREYGIVLNAGASGKVANNSCYANMMGGVVVRFAAISMVVEGNRIEKNSGPGLILEQGLRAEIYDGNSSRLNSGEELMSGVRFDE